MELLPPPPPFTSLEKDDASSSLKKTESKHKKPQVIKEPKEEFKPLDLKDAEKEIRQAVKKIQKKPSLWKRLLYRKRPAGREYPEISLKPEMDGVKAVQNLIKSSRNALLEFNLKKAKEFYIGANRIYNDLSVDKQAEVYNDIKNLYDERKSAEALKLT